MSNENGPTQRAAPSIIWKAHCTQLDNTTTNHNNTQDDISRAPYAELPTEVTGRLNGRHFFTLYVMMTFLLFSIYYTLTFKTTFFNIHYDFLNIPCNDFFRHIYYDFLNILYADFSQHAILCLFNDFFQHTVLWIVYKFFFMTCYCYGSTLRHNIVSTHKE